MNIVAGGPRIDLTSTDAVAELEAFVQCRLSGRIRDLRLVAMDGGVVLEGRTDTYYAKQLAQHAVMEACNSPVLANAIVVS